MRLTKLEINGFKSFAKKTELQIENGVTAIIGPNGSGKSNIADAVRWVLGEQSAKVLRGNRMEDVIFNGTEQRKPMAYCEVTLCFDNSDGALPMEFVEVSVTRRVYRSGESEFLINRTPCRLKDIHELFRDTGIGRDGYSIIGQGKVEEILSNRSNERRSAFEEAAGVMKYRVRKEEAERKLENTRKNLIRLNDILDELRDRLGPLEEQSAAAREYLKLREELKEIEVNIFLHQYDRLNERIGSLAEGLKELFENIESGARLEAAIGSECQAAEEKERALGNAIGELQSKLLAASSGAEAHAGEAKVMEERMANLVSERERMLNGIRESEEKRSAILKLIEEAGRKSGEGLSKLKEDEAALSAAEQRRAALEAEISLRENELETQKNGMIEAMNRISDARSRISRLEAIRASMLERMEQMLTRREDIAAEGEKLAQELNEAQQRSDAAESECRALDDARRDAVESVNRLNLSACRTREELQSMQQRIESDSARIKVLQEMKRAYEGYYSSVRSLLRDSQRDMSLKRRIEGVVAELIRVPEEYESAIEMTLGSQLQHIVTPDEQDAKRVIEYLREKKYGRATMLPVSTIRSRLLSREERALCKGDGFIGIASDLVGFEERYRGIVENLLGRTIIVKDLDSGIAINRESRSAFRIATLKGDIINPGGSMTGGSIQKREFSLIGREREMESLRASIDGARARSEQKKLELEGMELRVQEGMKAAEQANSELHAMELKLATQREKLEVIRKYCADNQQDLERAELERTQIQDNIDNIDEQFREADEDRAQWEQGNVATQDDIRKLQEGVAALRAGLSEANEVVTACRVALASDEKERHAILQELRRLEREAEQITAACERDRAAIEEGGRKLDEMRSGLLRMQEDIRAERNDVDGITEELRSLEEERAKRLTGLDELRERREKLALEVTERRERSHRLELSLSKAELELKSIQDRMWNDYELTYENALPFRRQIAVTASHIRIDELRTAMRELGDVNMAAIEDYRNVRERFDSLNSQCEDLVRAEADLQVLIEDLVSTMEREFRRQFELIQRNFTETFTQLFGGGRAELILSDKHDILNCDIDIIAQPPGKKLQLLSLLSGGERALTAIALLFAILKLKPAAFCILDEIESALDEANVSNFAEYVRNYSSSTQFILITHRKGSMAACDSLYGVAMEERGVSKVVSARFNETA